MIQITIKIMNLKIQLPSEKQDKREISYRETFLYNNVILSNQHFLIAEE